MWKENLLNTLLGALKQNLVFFFLFKHSYTPFSAYFSFFTSLRKLRSSNIQSKARKVDEMLFGLLSLNFEYVLE